MEFSAWPKDTLTCDLSTHGLSLYLQNKIKVHVVLYHNCLLTNVPVSTELFFRSLSIIDVIIVFVCAFE